MASLLGRADPALVTAAARAGLANVPGDYSKQFGIMAAANKTLLEGIAKVWTTHETKKKADQKALDDGMKELRNYGVGIENNADYNMFSDEMDAQIAIWKQNKGFINDSKRLREWERQNNKIMSKYKSNQVAMIEAVEVFESSGTWKKGMTNGVIVDGTYQNDIGFLTNIVGYAKNVDDKSGNKNSRANSYMANNTGADTDKKPEDLWKYLGGKDGEVVKYLDPATNEFTYITSVDGNVIAKKSSEISKMIPPREQDGETDVWTRVNGIRGLAKNQIHDYDNYNSALNQNALEKIIEERQINNPRALEYLMDQKYGPMTESFAEALKKGTAISTAAIIASLEGLNMGYKGDQKKGEAGHGVVDAGDFKDPGNYATIVQSILKDEKNYKLRRDLFVDHVDEMAFRPAWNNNKGTPKVDGVSGITLTIPQQLEQAEAVKIDKLVQQKDVSLLDLNRIITGTSSNPLKVVEDGNEYVIQNIAGKGDLVEYERFPISDREYLRAMLYKYSYTNPGYGDQNLKFTSKAPILGEEQKKVQAINPPKRLLEEARSQGRDVVYDMDYGWVIK